jgi:beta-glucosidase
MESSPEEVFDQLTLVEKISLLSGKSMWSLRDIPRLGVPSIRVSDGPQGIRKAVTELTALESFPATCFPTACALACSWNRSLVERVGKALAKECRHQGVHILLGPGLNLRRHPCGGRNFEYFSEDPVVSGHIAAAMVNGIQCSGHVGACVKHVCVNNQESWRFRVNVLVDERTLRELYLKGFEYVIKNAKPWSLMCAYNQLNGIYCSENAELFQQIVRKEWGYQGHVLTDWGGKLERRGQTGLFMLYYVSAC